MSHSLHCHFLGAPAAAVQAGWCGAEPPGAGKGLSTLPLHHAHGAGGRVLPFVLLASHHPGAASSCFGEQAEKVWLRSESVLASRKEFPVVGSTLICRKVCRQEACRLLVFTK